ncbi:hypothetical protein DPMN_048712 [Dreissena polymorpha]|uniref:Uncharacterized protein n=1 Tax=Dreissena polymorpha TaxID=45954 RepID=A0A9D4I357_DREPO|nr:hypothetical protein DPMN_048712 [Dreissena polymorpha]
MALIVLIVFEGIPSARRLDSSTRQLHLHNGTYRPRGYRGNRVGSSDTRHGMAITLLGIHLQAYTSSHTITC